MTFSIIIATDIKGGFSKNKTIPWYITEDLKMFRKLTTDKVIVMGRNTWNSLPNKPLINRTTFVISKTLEDNRCDKIFKNLKELRKYINKYHKREEVFICGGEYIYNYFFDHNLVTKIYITTIHNNYDCDQFVNFNELSLTKSKRFIKEKEQLLIDNCFFREFNYVNHEEQKFLSILENILENGSERIDRTNIGTKSIFGTELRFNLESHTFPLLTTRTLSLRMIFEELMWFIRGQTNVKILEDKNIFVWTPNSNREFLDKQGLYHLKPGDVGKSYGFQFRHKGAIYVDCNTDYTNQGFDQLNYVIDLLKNNPSSRRIIIDLWNTEEVALPPCGFCYQFYVDNGFLSCKLVQRSSDISLAGGWNIASAALFTYLLAAITNLKPKELIWSVGDCHIYLNQLKFIKEQTTRTPRLFPKLYLNNIPKNITEFEFNDLELLFYTPYPRIKLPLNA